MATALAITIDEVHVIGDIKMVVATLDFTNYGTGGVATTPDKFGLVQFIYAPPAFYPGEGFYSYDGATVKAYTAYGTEVSNATNLTATKMIVFGK